jgi:hypothetical protein
MRQAVTCRPLTGKCSVTRFAWDGPATSEPLGVLFSPRLCQQSSIRTYGCRGRPLQPSKDSCGIVNVSPGLHEIAVTAADGKAFHVSKAVAVEGNKILAVTLEVESH